MSPADAQDRAQVEQLAAAVQAATGDTVELAYVDQGYTGAAAAEAAHAHGIQLSVVKLPEAKRGFVLLPRRWVVERGFAWGGALSPTSPRLRASCHHFGEFHFLAFSCVMLHQFIHLMSSP